MNNSLSASLTRMDLAAYSSFNIALAFVALPLYVLLPAYYAQHHGLSLAWLGSVLLTSRLLDAIFDPILGAWLDRPHPSMSLASKRQRALFCGVLLLSFGMAILLAWPTSSKLIILSALACGLTLTYAGFSLCTIAYQAWGAQLGYNAIERARVTAWREGFGLCGVLLAAILPTWLGVAALWWPFVGLLMMGYLLLVHYAPLPIFDHLSHHTSPSDHSNAAIGWLVILRHPALRQLLSIFVLNGIASAIPATLFLFYVRDALHFQNYEAIFLLLYFLAGAVAMPLWISAAKYLGLVKAWLLGMGLAIISFAWVLILPNEPSAIAIWSFSGICILSGMALGADLALPAALLAGLLREKNNTQNIPPNTAFGLWNFCNKLNLALAAGLALPLLAWWGYQPNSIQTTTSLNALTLAYCGLPCLLKSLAALLLWHARYKLSPIPAESSLTLEYQNV